MSIEQLLPLVGLVSQVVLALLFTVVWRSLQRRWAQFLALGFAANAAMYVAMIIGTMRVALFGVPSTSVALLSIAAVVLITAAVIDYVGFDSQRAKRLNALSIAIAVVAVAIGLAGQLTRAAGLTVLSAYVLCWVLLFAGAMRREPHSGHGFVVVALLVYPLTVGAAVMGWVRPELLAGVGVLPFSVLGATLLTTGLLRAHRQAAEALAERELAQAALRATNDSLEQKVALRTEELRENIEGLESFNRSVSHDLRGPLGGIVGIARLARQQLAAGDRQQPDRLLDLIERQAVNSVRLVEALLALARAGDVTLDVHEVDSGRLVAEVLQSLQHGQASLPVVVVGTMPVVLADPELLRQVFVNLIGNAIKFARQVPSPRVEVGATLSAGQAVFHVRDNGMGFDPQHAPRLFKPFQRLHEEEHEGYGVGLSIVKRIVDRHGGRVWADGRPGEGASFYFVLGTALPTVAASRAPAQAASVPRW
jgi:signal transduction histidine kinase